VDLNAVISQAKSTLNTKIENANATIAVGKMPIHQGVAFQLRQLFVQLIDNAIKFRKPDVAPRIEISCDTVRGESIADPNPSQQFVHIEVSDNGIGIEPQYHDRVFELFKRLHSKDKYNGTGIGLSICRKIVENHRGFMTIDSKLGVGSTFHIYLPFGLNAIVS
jgi:signal transduction histidine kinase